MNLENEVKAVLIPHVLNNASFSAYNITQLVRKNNPNETIYHDDVKQVVHDYMNEYMQKNPGYTSNNNNGYIWYEPTHVWSYVGMTAPSSNVPQNTTQLHSVVSEGRVVVSKEVMDKLGIKKDSSYERVIKNGQVRIRPNKNGEYYYDGYCRFRVPKDAKVDLSKSHIRGKTLVIGV